MSRTPEGFFLCFSSQVTCIQPGADLRLWNPGGPDRIQFGSLDRRSSTRPCRPASPQNLGMWVKTSWYRFPLLPWESTSEFTALQGRVSLLPDPSCNSVQMIATIINCLDPPEVYRCFELGLTRRVSRRTTLRSPYPARIRKSVKILSPQYPRPSIGRCTSVLGRFLGIVGQDPGNLNFGMPPADHSQSALNL